MDKRDSRVDPADDNEALDNVAPVKSLTGGAAVCWAGEGGKGPGSDNEEDEGDGEGDEVGKDTERHVGAHHLESDGKNHCGNVSQARLGKTREDWELTSNEGGPDTGGETDPDSVTVRVGIHGWVAFIVVVRH